MVYWYNGNLIQANTIELAIDDPGLLYGATVFTTLRVYESLDSRLTQWAAHSDRLTRTLQAFGWEQPDWQRVRQGAELMVGFPVLRITLFPDGREWITGKLLPTDLASRQKLGICASVALSELERCLPSHKTGNYLSAWLAKANSQEAILVDTAGNWLETSTGNLWGWRDGSWWTPPLNAGILPGIVRSQLLKLLTVRSEPWTNELVTGMEALAYTNSVVEVIPIHTVIAGDLRLKYDPAHSSLQQLRRLFLP